VALYKKDRLDGNRHHEAGKGGALRFFADKKYRENYDKIFKKKSK
jgi:hypothetical protein